MLKWFDKNCNRAGWMMKIDDDTIFNPFVFKEVFQQNFIGKSSKLPVIIGSSVDSNSVR